jgi:hypothetical protein
MSRGIAGEQISKMLVVDLLESSFDPSGKVRRFLLARIPDI